MACVDMRNVQKNYKKLEKVFKALVILVLTYGVAFHHSTILTERGRGKLKFFLD